jgi:hypothetical protein
MKIFPRQFLPTVLSVLFFALLVFFQVGLAQLLHKRRGSPRQSHEIICRQIPQKKGPRSAVWFGLAFLHLFDIRITFGPLNGTHQCHCVEVTQNPGRGAWNVKGGMLRSVPAIDLLSYVNLSHNCPL